MQQASLFLTLPQGYITATSLGIAELASHRSPGPGKFFRGRSVIVQLATQGGAPAFQFLDEGGWRDANGDARAALAAVSTGGKRTKTALSNNGFSATPLGAYERVFLGKTGGQVLELSRGGTVTYAQGNCHEGMSPDEVAHEAGLPAVTGREPRLYVILGPIEGLVMTTLTPAEYGWYATRRPGKIFRQVMFFEITDDQHHLAAGPVFDEARRELTSNSRKKTKTIIFGDVLNQLSFQSIAGYDTPGTAGLCLADKHGLHTWSFPDAIPRAWDRAY